MYTRGKKEETLLVYGNVIRESSFPPRPLLFPSQCVELVTLHRCDGRRNISCCQVTHCVKERLMAMFQYTERSNRNASICHVM